MSEYLNGNYTCGKCKNFDPTKERNCGVSCISGGRDDLAKNCHKFKLVTRSHSQKNVFGHPRFYEILKQMGELHSRKNHDYAGTSEPLKNLKACERLNLEPFMGVMVRLQDKWSRLEEFVKSGSLMVKNESVIDTLLDNAVYSILAIILYEEQQKEEEK